MVNKKIFIIDRYLTTILFILYSLFLPFFEFHACFKWLSISCIVLLFACVILYFILSKRITFFYPMIPIISFPLFGLIGTVVFSHDYISFFKMILIIISMIVIYYSLKIINYPLISIKIIACSFAFFAVFFLLYYYKNIINFSDYDNFRIGLAFGNQNDVAMYFFVGLVISLYIVFYYQNKIDLLFGLFIPLFFMSGVLTGSRMFVVSSMLIALVIAIIKFHKKVIPLLASFIVIAVFCLCIAFVPLFSTIRDRTFDALISLFDGKSFDVSINQRAAWFEYGFFLGSKNAFIGYGFGGFDVRSGIGSFSHSNISEMLCDFGIIGFVSFYSTLLFFIFLIKKKKNIDYNLLFVPFLFGCSFLVESISVILYNDKLIYLVFGLCFYITSLFDDIMYCSVSFLIKNKNSPKIKDNNVQ